jgi:hypothetical protein
LFAIGYDYSGRGFPGIELHGLLLNQVNFTSTDFKYASFSGNVIGPSNFTTSYITFSNYTVTGSEHNITAALTLGGAVAESIIGIYRRDRL